MTIIEKIKALLAKAASTNNPHEAELFLAKAHELMEKHQLEAHDLETDDPVDGEHYYEKGSVKAAPDWDFNLIWEVAEYFGCQACRFQTRNGKWKMDIVGRDSARVTATEMHKYLVQTVRRLGREAVGTPGFALKNKWGETVGYMNADQCARRIGNALRMRLDELNVANKPAEDAAPTEAGRNALVTLDRVLALYNERHPNAKNVGGTFYSNASAAKIAGGIGLSQQMGGVKTRRLT